MRIEVDKDKCIGCRKCKEVCPKGPKIWKVNDKAEVMDLKFCHLCTLCGTKCPTGAIKIIRDDTNVKEEKIAEKD